VAGLIVYGSLINRDEIRSFCSALNCYYPVKLKGFQRVFNQEPSWRTVNGKESAVLNIIPNEDCWLNALLVTELSPDRLEAIDEREIGYKRIKVERNKISTYQQIAFESDELVYAYTGKKEKMNDSLLPKPDYLNICLTGSRQWGEEFYLDFLSTTFENRDGKLIPLKNRYHS
jgi:hypothetical protein